MKNTKSKRSRAKNPNLNPKLNSRVRQEYLDYDYLDKLNEEELAWLNKFTGEYNNGSVVLDENKQLDPANNLHQDPAHKKQLFDKNNFQNRDMFGLVNGKVGPTKLLNYEDAHNVVEEYFQGAVDPRNLENAYINFIDNLQVNEMIEEYDNAMLSFKEVSE